MSIEAPWAGVRLRIAVADHTGLVWRDLDHVLRRLDQAVRLAERIAAGWDRRHHARTTPASRRLPRRSARTAGPRRRRHTR